MDWKWILFQSTLPRGSDWFGLIWLLILCAFQSTLPRGSDLITNAPCSLAVDISIHAPSRERLQL